MWIIGWIGHAVPETERAILAVAEHLPRLMVEVKWADEAFSTSLAHFHKFLPKTKAVQVVGRLKRRRSSGKLDMVPCADYLAALDCMPHAKDA